MNKLFKRQQKVINKYVRKVNKSLEEDDAFLGRIYIRQFSAGFIEYSDKSGGMWVGALRIYDKVTNTYKTVLTDFHQYQNEIIMTLDRFIDDDLQIDIQRAIALKVDYRDVKHNPRDAEPFYPQYERNWSYKYNVQ